LKTRYRAEFKLAFADAVEALSFRDRNLLKYAFGDGLASDEIASIYGVQPHHGEPLDRGPRAIDDEGRARGAE